MIHERPEFSCYAALGTPGGGVLVYRTKSERATARIWSRTLYDSLMASPMPMLFGWDLGTGPCETLKILFSPDIDEALWEVRFQESDVSAHKPKPSL